MLHNNIEGFTVYTTDLKGASKVEAYSTFIIGIRQTYVEYDPPYVPIVLQQSKRIPFFFHVVHKAKLYWLVLVSNASMACVHYIGK